jgi:hypothetical protein
MRPPAAGAAGKNHALNCLGNSAQRSPPAVYGVVSALLTNKAAAGRFSYRLADSRALLERGKNRTALVCAVHYIHLKPFAITNSRLPARAKYIPIAQTLFEAISFRRPLICCVRQPRGKAIVWTMYVSQTSGR